MTNSDLQTLFEKCRRQITVPASLALAILFTGCAQQELVGDHSRAASCAETHNDAACDYYCDETGIAYVHTSRDVIEAYQFGSGKYGCFNNPGKENMPWEGPAVEGDLEVRGKSHMEEFTVRDTVHGKRVKRPVYNRTINFDMIASKYPWIHRPGEAMHDTHDTDDKNSMNPNDFSSCECFVSNHATVNHVENLIDEFSFNKRWRVVGRDSELPEEIRALKPMLLDKSRHVYVLAKRRPTSWTNNIYLAQSDFIPKSPHP